MDNTMNGITDRLIRSLSDLASVYRGLCRQGDTAGVERTVAAYHAVMAVLWELPWDRNLDVMEELPDTLMPTYYIEYWQERWRQNAITDSSS